MMATLMLGPDGYLKGFVNCSRKSEAYRLQAFNNVRLNGSGKYLPASLVHYKNVFSNQRKLHGSVWCAKDSNFIVSASGGDSKDSIREITFQEDTDGLQSGIGQVSKVRMDEVAAMRVALQEANARAAAAEQGRRKATDELARVEVKQKEYADNLVHNTKLAVSELEAAKASFHQQIQKLLDEKLAVQSELVLAKEDAIDLAVQVEKFAEIAIQDATAHIVEEAKLRVSAAETSATEATHQVEEKLRNAANDGSVTVVTESKDLVDKSFAIAEAAREQANKANAALHEGLHVLDKLVHVESSNLGLQNAVHNLERQLKATQNEIGKLQAELKAAEARANAAEAQAAASYKALLEVQESADRAALAQEETSKHALEVLKKAAAEREEAAARTFKLELESMQSAFDAVKKAEGIKEQAYLRRFEALERALTAAEANAKAWKERSQTAELLLQKTRGGMDKGEEPEYMLNGGRIGLLIGDDSQKWNLLAHGPRRETPEWMARRMDCVCPKFPPVKHKAPEQVIEAAIPLDLPKPEEVWSIAKEKLKENDMFTKQAAEREALKKQRKALERVLQRKTIKKQKVLEETKIEPGTGTGREIVLWHTHIMQKTAIENHKLGDHSITL